MKICISDYNYNNIKIPFTDISSNQGSLLVSIKVIVRRCMVRIFGTKVSS